MDNFLFLFKRKQWNPTSWFNIINSQSIYVIPPRYVYNLIHNSIKNILE